MGARYKFQIIEKSKLEEIRHLTYNQIFDWCERNNVHVDGQWFAAYEIGTGLFDLGEDYPNAGYIKSLGTPFFTDGYLDYINEEYGMTVVDHNAILEAINFQKSQIISHYKSMLFPSGEEEKKMRNNPVYAAAIYKAHIELMFAEWTGDSIAINTDANSKAISKSWKYEYSIFELLSIYKTLDFEKYAVIFIGM